MLITLLIVGAGLLGAEAKTYDIRRSGAIGDGVTVNTGAIQKAIDSCAATGGTVYVPQGIYLTGTLVLKSNVTLHIAAGATLLGHTSPSAYPYQDPGIPFYGGDWAKQALIFCKGQENVAIEGRGTIDGQGSAFVTTTLKKPDRYRNRPYLLWFAGCKDVSVTGVHLRNSAFWMQHYLGCERVRIDGVDIWNHSNKNNDMIDIDGCRNVMISNVTGDSDDDGITIKSSSPGVSEFITITNCILSSHCNAIKFGTESTGGFRNITISNCVVRPSAQTKTIYGRPAGIAGLALEMVDGGIMENVAISNLVIEGPEVPIFIRLGNRARKYVETAAVPGPGQLRDLRISNVVARGSSNIGCSITGIKSARVERISLSDITVESAGGGTRADFRPLSDEKEDSYPEATMFGKLPAYGFYISHAEEVHLSGIRLTTKTTDARPAVYWSDTRGFSLTGLSVPAGSSTSGPVVAVRESTGGFLSQGGLPAKFLDVDKTSKGIRTGQ
ncbi:glycoside hydrolase family 28 protein [Ravibacter arvi]|uniref:Glycoside hydrolase family 28 protein n=2 Tax=Ravibacter arvi TaxID=2051041 RepID=A0ABP8LPB8_9BACT